MEMVASTEVTSIWRRRDIEKSTWRTHRYFIDFESGIHVEFSTLNRCHNFHVDLPFKIDEISTNFPRGISTWNRWRIDEDVSIGNPFWLLPKNNDINGRYSTTIKFKKEKGKFCEILHLSLATIPGIDRSALNIAH